MVHNQDIHLRFTTKICLTNQLESDNMRLVFSPDLYIRIPITGYEQYISPQR